MLLLISLWYYLRGSDIKRWYPEWQNLWMLVLKSSGDYAWSWADSNKAAEEIFAQTFPSIYQYLKPLENKLRNRQDQGRYWWELRPCSNYEAFQKPKYLIQGIAFHPRISLDTGGMYINNAGFILPTADPWLLLVLNSPIMWCFIFRYLPHKKDEAIAMDAACVETLPIAPPPTTSDRK